MALRIGVARADITPATGISMVGFAGRGPAAEVHDPLRATALAADDGAGAALLLSLDLLQLQADTVAAYRQRIAAATGVDAAHVTIACAHNHYGPAVYRDESDVVAAYREHLGHVLAGVSRRAVEALQPAHLGWAQGASDIGINRRERRDGRIVLGNNPDGPVDRRVDLVRIDTADGAPLASLLNFACHPVSQGGAMARISADFVGRARDLVEAHTGAPCLYLQGACGDVNPIRMENAYEPARSLGVRLGCEALRLWETVVPEAAEGLAVRARGLSLPAYRYGSEAEAHRLADELEAEVREREARGDDSGGLWWARLRRERVQAALASWRGGPALPQIEAEVSAWRLGPLALATAPGEIFAENGALVKAGSPLQPTLFLGYTNGSIGYVPTRSAYPEGGYEVTHACRVDPDAGEAINDGCLELLGQV